VTLFDHLLDGLPGDAEEAPCFAAIPARECQGLVEHDLANALLNLADRCHTDVPRYLGLEGWRMLQCGLDRRVEVIEREGLGDVAVHSQSGELESLLRRCQAAHRDYRRCWSHLAGEPRELDCAAVWQVDVEQDELGLGRQQVACLR
jgi:hypothetical protein